MRTFEELPQDKTLVNYALAAVKPELIELLIMCFELNISSV